MITLFLCANAVDETYHHPFRIKFTVPIASPLDGDETMADAVDNMLGLRELPLAAEVMRISAPLFLGLFCVLLMLEEKVEGSRPAEIFPTQPKGEGGHASIYCSHPIKRVILNIFRIWHLARWVHFGFFFATRHFNMHSHCCLEFLVTSPPQQ